MDPGISSSEQKLRNIMRFAPIGLIEIDDSGIIVNINISGQRLLSPLKGAELIEGDNLFESLDHISKDIRVKVEQFEAASGLVVQNNIHHFAYPNGVKKDFQFTITRMFPGCTIVSLEDITEKVAEEKAFRQAEQDKAVAQGKYEIASEVLHDIGNAMVGFGSYLTRINRTLDNNNQANLRNATAFIKQQQQAIASAIGEQKATALVTLLEGIVSAQQVNFEDIRTSITEQLRIISHVQDILNIQRQYVTGHGSQERKLVNLKEILHDCQAMAFANIEKKGITFNLSTPPKPVHIKGDRTKMMQVIMNLIKNSIEAIDIQSEEKQISIRLSDDDERIELIITDTGSGFDEQTASRLFERGYTTKSSGSGLGLYNCRSIIESHSGQLTITSAGEGKGSRAIILFNK